MHLLRRSLEHARLSGELAASACVGWQREGYRRGAELAQRYQVPACHGQPVRYHVRVTWPAGPAVPGPVAIGAGRYGGLGLMAAESGTSHGG